jgi:hypothetical protein
LTYKYFSFVLFFGFLFGINFNLVAQKNYKWQKLNVPPYSEISQIQAVNGDTIFLADNHLYYMVGDSIHYFKPQPPINIHKIFAIGANNIYVSNNSPYQNSKLYNWNGKSWKLLNINMANQIYDIYFDSTQTGAFTSYGEIILLNKNITKHLPPPVNRTISEVFINHDTLIILSPGKGVYKYFKAWKNIKHSQDAKHILLLKNQFYIIGKNYLGKIENNQITKISQNNIWQNINDLCLYKNNIWGVGQNGFLFHLDHNQMVTDSFPTQNHLLKIINTNNYLYVVDDHHNLWKFTPNHKTYKQQWQGFKRKDFKDKAKVIDDEYGVVIADFNNDNRPDIFTAGLFEKDHLYINQGDDRFIDQAESFGLIEKNNQTGQLNLAACAGDIDNDGYIDLYVSVLNGKNILYKNIKGKYFIDYSHIAHASGLKTDRSNACAMADVDLDGDLDIFVANEYGTNRLFINNGTGIFNEITLESGLQTNEGGNGAAFVDIDNDGDEDLYVTNWSQSNILYRNDFKETGKIHFTDISKSSNTGGAAYLKSNAVIWTDIDNDADMDLFVTNRLGGNKLYYNDGQGHFSAPKQIGHENDATYGAVISDFDNDGYKDIYLANVGTNKFFLQKKQGFQRIDKMTAIKIK